MARLHEVDEALRAEYSLRRRMLIERAQVRPRRQPAPAPAGARTA